MKTRLVRQLALLATAGSLLWIGAKLSAQMPVPKLPPVGSLPTFENVTDKAHINFVHSYGELYIYEVKSISERHATDPAILQHEEKSWLTLVTCADYSESAETYLKRLVVKAEFIQNQPDRWRSSGQ